ncbi:membrane protein [Streptococcus varani]|uniref:Membrane protein n=2 Tax=Bacteria TaxID=2 RepID=A0A0E4H6Q3_9STRE|nr:cytoskeleton protein RodZ [Streptococcus varani]CQR23942.1 membrane protein [Streptococcus varani]
MRQKSIGEVLRDARESRGWTFADIQRMTKIQARLVQALEYNDFEMIPDRDYTRTFLQRYAEVLDLDAAVILDAFDSNSLIAYYDAGEELGSGIESRRNNKKKKSIKSYLPLIYLLLAAIFILIFIAYIVSQRIQNQAITPPSTSYSVVSQTSESQATTEAVDSSAPTPTTEEEEAVTKLNVSGDASNLTVTVAHAKKPVEVELKVSTVTSWISLTDTDIANGLVLSPDNPHVKITLPEGVTSPTLTLGVVQGVEVMIAGQRLDTSKLTEQTAYIHLIIE